MFNIELNFFEIFMNEGGSFYDEFRRINGDHFNAWASNTFVLKYSAKTIADIIPDLTTIKMFQQLGYDHRPSQCHYSSKAISLLDSDYEYWTGFVCNQDPISYNRITHSFRNCLNFNF